jgi:hypothetical protein
LGAAARQPRQQSAGRLDPVLRISCEPDHGVADAFGS